MINLSSRLDGIVRILKSDDGFIILENPIQQSDKRFQTSEDVVNLYKVDNNFLLVWEAELPGSDERYYGNLTIENGQLKAFTGNCRCYLDIGTGKLIAKYPNR